MYNDLSANYDNSTIICIDYDLKTFKTNKKISHNNCNKNAVG